MQIDEEDEFYSQDLVGLTVLLLPYHAAAQSEPAQQTATNSSESKSDVVSASTSSTAVNSSSESAAACLSGASVGADVEIEAEKDAHVAGDGSTDLGNTHAGV